MKIRTSMSPASTLASALLAGALVAACGKKEEVPEPSAQRPQESMSAATAGPTVVTANDQMQFSTKTIEAKSGSEVVIILHNIGSMPKESMGHNMIILQPGIVVADFAAKAMNAKETDYIPKSDSASIFAHTRLLGPGESDTLRFTAPAAGEYPFLCSFPGHFAMMNGTLTVQ